MGVSLLTVRLNLGQREKVFPFSRIAVVVQYDYRPSHPHNVRTEHVEFLPTREALLAPKVIGGYLPTMRECCFGRSQYCSDYMVVVWGGGGGVDHSCPDRL